MKDSTCFNKFILATITLASFSSMSFAINYPVKGNGLVPASMESVTALNLNLIPANLKDKKLDRK